MGPSRPLLKIVGALLLVAGFALASLLTLILVRHSARLPVLASTTAGALAIITFLVLLGYRLVFNRPNRHGSLLSPITWTVLAAGFAFLAVVMAVNGRAGDLTPIAPALAAALLAYLCFLAARGVRREPSSTPPSPVFAPDASLLEMGGFTPAGFRCGLEILNDDRTPMEFVVSVLQKNLGLNEPEAIRTMLEIHGKGGVIVASASFEESKRVADAVTAEARLANHPFVCRAVSVEGA